MKKNTPLIILIIVTIVTFIGAKRYCNCVLEAYRQQDIAPINVWSFTALQADFHKYGVAKRHDLDVFVSNYYDLIQRKSEDWDMIKVYQDRVDAAPQYAAYCDTASIVYVTRIASANIMNSPAFFKENTSDNVIYAKGKGADLEDVTVISLSDGYIIKASPRAHPEWLGVQVGERVIRKKVYDYTSKGFKGSVRYTPTFGL